MATNMWENGPNGKTHIKITEDTCIAPPIPMLTNQASKQGGFFPKKLQKQWKKELPTYHIIKKAIKLIT